MDGFVLETIQSDVENLSVAPSVLRADRHAHLQIIENNNGASTAVGFVVFKSIEFNRSQYASLLIHRFCKAYVRHSICSQNRAESLWKLVEIE
jgi:hypothetical protein